MQDKTEFIFHDRDESDRLTLDLGSDKLEQNRSLAEEEEHAENLRLLYVALTRAKHRCYFPWGCINDANTSALAYLLHQRVADEDAELTRTRLQVEFPKWSDEDIEFDLNRLAERAQGEVEICDLPRDIAFHNAADLAPQLKEGEEAPEKKEPAPVLRARSFSGEVGRKWRITSYSALGLSRTATTHEGLDHDQEETLVVSVGAQRGIFAFPKGALPGTLMHKIFEDIDFQQPHQIEDNVCRLSGHYGYAETWIPVLVDMVKNVLAVQLDGLCLNEISPANRLNELQFYYPLAPITGESLTRIFQEYGQDTGHNVADQIGSLTFSPVQGYMKGFIDLVVEKDGKWWIVDYKSNYLGANLASYGEDRLQYEMIQANYILQYHIYTVALHRYLQFRLEGYAYDRNFGGVYYLFLRGIRADMGRPYGVYYDKPPIELIERLSNYFAGRPDAFRGSGQTSSS